VVTPAHPCPPLHAERRCIGFLPAPSEVEIPARWAGSLTLWSQRHHGVPGTPPRTADSNSQNADSHSGVTAGHEIVQNEPNFTRPEETDRGNRAKRSQFSPGRSGHRRVNAQNEPNSARLRAGAGGQMRKTNPIPSRHRRLTQGIVQNEAKLGGTGLYGQDGCRVVVARPASETCKTNPIRPRSAGAPEGKCAKRTQFASRGQMVGSAHPTKRAGAPVAEECAKRTQFPENALRRHYQRA
jgi:hypothetical protein